MTLEEKKNTGKKQTKTKQQQNKIMLNIERTKYTGNTENQFQYDYKDLAFLE